MINPPQPGLAIPALPDYKIDWASSIVEGQRPDEFSGSNINLKIQANGEIGIEETTQIGVRSVTMILEPGHSIKWISDLKSAPILVIKYAYVGHPYNLCHICFKTDGDRDDVKRLLNRFVGRLII